MLEEANAIDNVIIGMLANAGVVEHASIKGHYDIECVDGDGNVLWTDVADNVVTTGGQNQLLTNGLTTAAFMFLITSASFSAVAAADTMASHAGWLEAAGANAPNYSGNRPSAAFAAASGGAATLTASLQFVFTNSGTLQGLGIVFGTGASATQGNTSGVLLSAGTLAAAQPVISGNTINANYTITL